MMSKKKKSGGVISVEMIPIGIIHSCYKEKFGIPRQPGLVDKALASIELYPPYGRTETVKELETFSHLWVQFLFHDILDEGWKPTVRPPGLGGQQRVGVFASRSPHRPNHIGLSVTKILDIQTIGKRIVIDVGGGDFLDGTPVLDIKPYIAYSDAIESTSGGFSAKGLSQAKVVLSEVAKSFCRRYELDTGRDLAGLIIQVLRQDPRPASQRGRTKIFGVLLWDVNVRWRAQDDLFEVLECSLYQEPPNPCKVQ